MHTRFSGRKWAAPGLSNAGLEAGVDALLVSDHNVLVQGFGLRITKGRQRLLMLVGEELHDTILKEKGSHLLVLGTTRSFPPHAIHKNDRPGKRRWRAQLHRPPVEEPLRIFGEGEFGWRDWSVKGYTALSSGTS